MSILKIYSNHSVFMDLGTTTDTLYSIARENEFYRVYLGHIQPYLLLFSLPFKFFSPDVSLYIIVAIQVLIIICPLFIIKKRFGNIGSLIYLCNPIIYFLALSSFHIDILIIPMLILFIDYCESKNYNISYLISYLILFIKETFAPISFFCGLYLLIKSRDISKSIILMLASSLYFIIALYFIIPKFIIYENSYISGFDQYGQNILTIIINIIYNFDKFIINIFLDSSKLKFLFIIILVFPLLLIKFNLLLIISIPIFIMLLASNNSNYYSFGHHYVAPLFPIFIYISLLNLNKFNSLKKYYLYYSIFICFLISPAPLSRLFFSDKIEFFNYKSYILDVRNKKIKELLFSLASNTNFNTIISIQNNIFNPSLFTTSTVLLYPSGVFEPFTYPFKSTRSENKIFYADFVIIDTKRQPFLFDSSCDYYYGNCTNMNFQSEYNDLHKLINREFLIYKEYDGFFIYKRSQ